MRSDDNVVNIADRLHGAGEDAPKASLLTPEEQAEYLERAKTTLARAILEARPGINLARPPRAVMAPEQADALAFWIAAAAAHARADVMVDMGLLAPEALEISGIHLGVANDYAFRILTGTLGQ